MFDYSCHNQHLTFDVRSEQMGYAMFESTLTLKDVRCHLVREKLQIIRNFQIELTDSSKNGNDA